MSPPSNGTGLSPTLFAMPLFPLVRNTGPSSLFRLTLGSPSALSIAGLFTPNAPVGGPKYAASSLTFLRCGLALELCGMAVSGGKGREGAVGVGAMLVGH